MASRKYTAEDYGACRWVLENNVGPSAHNGNVTTAGPLTPAIGSRLILLNLADGALNTLADGSVLRLSGLGRKSGKEAQRLGVAAIS